MSFAQGAKRFQIRTKPEKMREIKANVIIYSICVLFNVVPASKLVIPMIALTELRISLLISAKKCGWRIPFGNQTPTARRKSWIPSNKNAGRIRGADIALIATLMEKYGKPVYGVSVACDQVTRIFFDEVNYA
jgi:hypothetical protein